MTLKESFIKEVNIGDKVEFIIGTKSIFGTVIELYSDTVRIRKEDGNEPIFSLDLISYYEVYNQSENNKTDLNSVDNTPKISTIVFKDKEHYHSDKKVMDLNINKRTEDIIEELNNRNSSFFNNIKIPTIREFNNVSELTENLSLKNDISSIANSIYYAINQAHEISPADYKLQENITKIKRLIIDYPEYKTPYNLLASVYYKCKCDGLSLEAFENGDDNESAFAIAESLHNEEKKLKFAIRHFIYDDYANSYIYKYILEQMINNEDYSLFTKIETKNINKDKLFAYHSIIRAIFLANNVEYNSMFDFEVTEDSLKDLLLIFKSRKIGNKIEFINYLPIEKFVKKQKNIIQDNRPLEECPIFAAAERARTNDKDLNKAEKLYIDAIKKNEKPGSAVANLYQIYIQKKRFKDCAKYLGQYGSKYMRDGAYKNLKREFLKIAPRMKNEVEKYEKKENDLIDYFILAQKAEIEEKNPQKSITYYIKAIDSKQRLSSTVPNLVSIYSRLEMYKEALELLDNKGKQVMEKSAFLNLKQSILLKAKDKKYKSHIEETFDLIIDMASSIEKKTEIAATKANLLFQIEEIDLALKIYENCLKNLHNKNYSKEKYNKQKVYILTGLCKIYIYMNNIEKSQQYARQILYIENNNEFASSVLSGNIDEDFELNDEDFDSIEEHIGVTNINKYIQNKLEQINLDYELEINKALIKNGEFIGDQNKASKVLFDTTFKRNKSLNEETKSNRYFAAAKLIKQILKRDEAIDLKTFNEGRILYCIAQGSCSYANSRLYRTELADNIDVAKYFYIQSMTIFNDSEKFRPCWAVSTIRYIQTYFFSLDNIRKEARRLYQKYKDFDSFIMAIQKIMQKPIITDITTFTIGMIELLNYNTRIKKDVLNFINLNAFQGKILDVLAKILGKNVPDITTVYALEDIWDEASKEYYTLRKFYLRLINETIESLSSVSKLQINLEKLKSNKFNLFLNRTDKEYIENLYSIFSNILRYNEVSEFDYKADILKKADDTRKRLEETINEYPTYLSYEKFIFQLEQIQAKIFKESILLYDNSKPQITVTLSGDSSFKKDSMELLVPIAFTNKINSQIADNVQINITGENVKLINNNQLIRGLLPGNGSAKEELFTFKISDKVLQEKSFSIEVNVNYQYQKNMTEIESSSKKFILSIPLHSRQVFEQIENKFKIISGGNPVEDKSMFYGRDEFIKSIINKINNTDLNSKSGKCIAIYGQTRTGKSSILIHLKNSLRKIEDKYIIIDMDSLGLLEFKSDTIVDFLYKLLRSLKKELKDNHKELLNQMECEGIIIDENILLNNIEQYQIKFNEIFEDFYYFTKRQDKSYRIILTIDEFTYLYDWICNGEISDRIMHFWKAFLQTYNMFAVIIGQEHMIQFISDKRFTNDFGTTELCKVSYLPEDYAKRLMYEPIFYINENGEKINRYRNEALDRLYELTSGSAYLIGKFCDLLVEYLNEINSIYINKAHIDDCLKKKISSFDEVPFEPQYTDLSDIGKKYMLSEKNKVILHRIALCSNKKEYAPIDSVVKTEEDRYILDRLVQRDVVELLNGERCKIKVSLYKEWLLK